MKTQYLFSAGVLLALGVACGVDVGIDGKECPCEASEGYVCDTAKNVCVHPNQLTAATTPPPPACDPCTCKVDADCKDPSRPACTSSGVCVQCVPGAGDKCAAGTYCNTKNQCTIGCRSNDDCAKLSATSPFCQLDRHQCVTCLTSDSCGGKTCTPSGTCATSCTGKAQCAGGQDCCGGLCIDVATDVLNCGTCNTACTADNGTPSCKSGACGADCADGFGTCAGGGTCLTELRTDPSNCGKCGTVCATLPHVINTSCALGTCHFEKCADGWVDTNTKPEDGCEAQCGNAVGADCCPGDKCFATGLTCNTGNHKCKSGGPQ
jgi:hypothetical protein